MKLNQDKWKSFKISSIFTILNGKGITKEEIEENSGNFVVVQSGEENNGVLGKIDLSYCKDMDYIYSEIPCLTVARSGSAGFVSYHDNGCVAGDSAKILLLKKENCNRNIYLFLQSVLTANRFKYAYGRKVTKEKYENDTIKLPILYTNDNKPYIDNSNQYSSYGYVPDWEYMDNYINSIHSKPITTRNKPGINSNFNINNWHKFKFGNLISFNNIYKAKAYKDEELIFVDSGSHDALPYVTRTEDNNGVKAFVSSKCVTDIEKGNALVIGDTTSTISYQGDDFITGDHMVVIRPDWLNKYTGLFITTILKKERYRYSYGRAYKIDLIKTTLVKLPVMRNTDGTPYIDKTKKYSEKGFVPDWLFMENYIKSLPYGDRI